jgi:hypothetical protein
MSKVVGSITRDSRREYYAGWLSRSVTWEEQAEDTLVPLVFQSTFSTIFAGQLTVEYLGGVH